jgi:hypothetical protein
MMTQMTDLHGAPGDIISLPEGKQLELLWQLLISEAYYNSPH